MSFRRIALFSTLLLLISRVGALRAQDHKPPREDRELIALVSGEALSEDVVHEVESRGLAFHPSDAIGRCWPGRRGRSNDQSSEWRPLGT